MNAMKQQSVRVTRAAYRAAIAVLLILCMLFAPPSAMAAKKKKKDEEARPTKSYVLPYFIVMMLVGVGLMTVCRPGSRKDRLEEKRKKDEV